MKKMKKTIPNGRISNMVITKDKRLKQVVVQESKGRYYPTPVYDLNYNRTKYNTIQAPRPGNIILRQAVMNGQIMIFSYKFDDDLNETNIKIDINAVHPAILRWLNSRAVEELPQGEWWDGTSTVLNRVKIRNITGTLRSMIHYLPKDFLDVAIRSPRVMIQSDWKTANKVEGFIEYETLPDTDKVFIGIWRKGFSGKVEVNEVENRGCFTMPLTDKVGRVAIVEYLCHEKDGEKLHAKVTLFEQEDISQDAQSSEKAVEPTQAPILGNEDPITPSEQAAVDELILPGMDPAKDISQDAMSSNVSLDAPLSQDNDDTDYALKADDAIEAEVKIEIEEDDIDSHTPGFK